MGDVVKSAIKKTVLCVVAAFAVCVVSFSLLKVAAFLVPTSLLQDNVGSSVDELDAEGQYHELLPLDAEWMVDGFTTALMLNVSTVEYDSAVDGLSWDLYYSEPIPDDASMAQVESLAGSRGKQADYASPGWVPFYRYWHGYVIVIRPLLVFMDLNGIRMLFIALFGVLLLSTVILLARLTDALAAIVYGLSFFAVHWFVAMVSPSLSFSFFIALVGILFVELHQEGKWSLDVPVDQWLPRWATVFFVLGALTVFFDFLDNPIITLGCPCALMVFLNRGRVESARTLLYGFVAIVLACCVWGLGYVSLWASKWVISSLLTGQDVLSNAIEQVAYRSGEATSSAEGAFHFSRMDAVKRNVYALVDHPVLDTTIVMVVVALLVAIVRLRGGSFRALLWLPLLVLVGLLPIAWFVFVANHSYLHYWFVYRDLLVTVMAVAFILAALVRDISSGSRLNRAGGERTAVVD